ncbi:MAG TPA: cation:proton antiporter [Chloroflexota bacterium]|nr:cation:proton antiporter [Chloroflexota bacterium]
METAVVEQVMGLLLVAFVVGLLVRRLFVPYTVALLVVGIGLGFTDVLSGLTLTSQTILVVFLPALLFQAAINLDLTALREAVLPIALLAVIGVGISIAMLAGLFGLALGVSGVVAVVLAAMLSATDPVAVLAVFKRLGVPKRLEMLIEGESLFNDGTALVAFQIAVQASSSGRVSVVAGIGQFCLTVIGGLLLGGLAGYACSRILAITDDHLFEMGLSTILAYGTYLVGEAVHVSPVIAVVTAGIVLGNNGRERGLSERARVVVIDIWEYLAFVANSVIFLLIGQQVHAINYRSYLLPSLAAVMLVLLSRAVVVYGLTPIVSTFQRHVPFSWRHVAFWGGLRGALAIAMALSLPRDFPQRDMLLAAVFSVVLFTILVQGVSMEHLVRRLKLREPRQSGQGR